jgi:hypothetical protein
MIIEFYLEKPHERFIFCDVTIEAVVGRLIRLNQYQGAVNR